jgi:hypothetical protein
MRKVLDVPAGRRLYAARSRARTVSLCSTRLISALSLCTTAADVRAGAKSESRFARPYRSSTSAGTAGSASMRAGALHRQRLNHHPSMINSMINSMLFSKGGNNECLWC